MANDRPTIERIYRVRDGDGSLLGDFQAMEITADVMTLYCQEDGTATTITVDRKPWAVTDADLAVHPAKIRSVMRERIGNGES